MVENNVSFFLNVQYKRFINHYTAIKEHQYSSFFLHLCIRNEIYHVIMNNRLVILMLASATLFVSCKSGDGQKQEVKPVRVSTVKVMNGAAEGGQCFSGTIEETYGSVLSFAVSGTLQSVNVSVGQRVNKGQLIAVVDEATLRNAHDIAASTLNQAQDAYRRMKQLHDNGSLPEIQWIEVQSKLAQAEASERIAKKSLTDSRLYAPFSGVIAEKNVEAGQNVMAGVPVVKLVKTNQVKVKIAVPENEIANVKTGQSLSVVVSALGGKQFTARIIEKGVEANPLTRSYEVKALLNNPTGELMPGMICDAFIRSGAQSSCIILPSHIIQLDKNNQQFVWINDNGKARKRVITTGELTAQGVTVMSGLAEGDEVLTEGQQKVSEGMTITTKK